jgi:hypothetical protein
MYVHILKRGHVGFEPVVMYFQTVWFAHKKLLPEMI